MNYEQGYRDGAAAVVTEMRRKLADYEAKISVPGVATVGRAFGPLAAAGHDLAMRGFRGLIEQFESTDWYAQRNGEAEGS